MRNTIGTSSANGILTIDLAALRYNYGLLVEYAKPAHVAAVVKANAYGLGADHVAPALYDVGCRLFFVAQLSEAVQLRPFLPADAQIAILNDIADQAIEFTARSAFIPVLNSLASVQSWARFCQEKKQKFPAMIQIDTGMSRLGLSQQEVEQLVANPEIFSQFSLLYVLSHLACADIDNHPLNQKQLVCFQNLARQMPFIASSLANSAAIALGDAYRFDMVRPGIALYGVNPYEGAFADLRPVVQLNIRVIQTRFLKENAVIGYGATYFVSEPRYIATLAAGYADGIFRSLSNCGALYFKGKRLPIVGRISMDSMNIDVTSLGDARPERDEFVEWIGPSQSLSQLAQDAGTIPYEILTALGNRYERRFIG